MPVKNRLIGFSHSLAMIARRHKFRLLFVCVTALLIVFFVVFEMPKTTLETSTILSSHYPSPAQVWHPSSMKSVSLTKLHMPSLQNLWVSADANMVIGITQSSPSITISAIDMRSAHAQILVSDIPSPPHPLDAFLSNILATDGAFIAWFDFSQPEGTQSVVQDISYMAIRDHIVHTSAIETYATNSVIPPKLVVENGFAFWIDASQHVQTRNLADGTSSVIAPEATFRQLPYLNYPNVFFQTNAGQDCHLADLNMEAETTRRLPCPQGNIMSQVDNQLFAVSSKVSGTASAFTIWRLNLAASLPMWNNVGMFTAISASFAINDRLAVWGGADPVNANQPELLAYDFKLKRIVLINDVDLGYALDGSAFAYVRQVRSDLDLITLNTSTL